MFYFDERSLPPVLLPVTMRIFLSFLGSAALMYRKQVIAMNEFEKMREERASIVYRFLLSMCGSAGTGTGRGRKEKELKNLLNCQMDGNGV